MQAKSYIPYSLKFIWLWWPIFQYFVWLSLMKNISCSFIDCWVWLSRTFCLPSRSLYWRSCNWAHNLSYPYNLMWRYFLLLFDWIHSISIVTAFNFWRTLWLREILLKLWDMHTWLHFFWWGRLIKRIILFQHISLFH